MSPGGSPAAENASRIDTVSRAGNSRAVASGTIGIPPAAPASAPRWKGHTLSLSRAADQPVAAALPEKRFDYREKPGVSAGRPVAVSENPDQGFRAETGHDGVTAVYRDADERWARETGETPRPALSWRLTGAGRGETGAVTASAPRAALDWKGADATLKRGDSREWLRQSADGLEHGFDLDRRPEGTGPLRLTLAFQTVLEPVLSDSDTLRFLEPNRVEAFRYEKLEVYDADGNRIPAHMEEGAERAPKSGIELTLVMDDSRARYPLRVDPVLRGTTVRSFSGSLPDVSNPNFIFMMGEHWYFWADDGIHGHELWKSDGTAAGTVLLKDIATGPRASAYPPYPGGGGVPVAGEDVFYFNGRSESAGNELWRSDGTEAGTRMVADIFPGRHGSHPEGMVIWKGEVYFRAFRPDTGYELWKSDGSEEGTVLLKNIARFTSSGIPGGFTPLGNSLLFFAGDDFRYTSAFDFPGSPPRWSELWSTDGTPDGTSRVKPMTGTLPSFPSGPALTRVGDACFFHSSGIWTTDGTAAGTTRKWFGTGWLEQPIMEMGGAAYFVGGLSLSWGWQVCVIRPGAEPVAVKNITPPGEPRPTGLTLAGGYLFFSAVDGTRGAELWRTDGTAEGTILLKDINPGNESSSPTMLGVSGGVLYFSAVDPEHGRELWKSDGTEAGTVLVRDIRPGKESGEPSAGSGKNGVLLFSADDGVKGRELWRTDGTGGGTQMVKEIYSVRKNSGASNPRLVAGNGNWRYYSSGPEGNMQLGRTDGTPGGTYSITRFRAAQGEGYWGSGVTDGDRIYFLASSTAYGRELWVSDGALENTRMVRDLRPGPDSPAISGMTVWNGAVYFGADDGENGVEVWKSDGTGAGTVRLTNFPPEIQNPPQFRAGDGVLYFIVLDSETGAQLWKTDGTAGGTALVKRGTPEAKYLDIYDPLFSGGKLFLGRYGVWTSDGTAEGTSQLIAYQINPNFPAPLFGKNAAGGKGVVFAGETAAEGRELWITDGTPEGTRLLRDIWPGPNSSDIAESLSAGNYVFFIANTPEAGMEYWRTDGTPEGTILLKDIVPGRTGSRISPYDLTKPLVSEGVVYFVPADEEHGRELWRTDGTPEGTYLLEDLAPGPRSSDPSSITKLGDKIIYTASTDGENFSVLRVLEPEELPTEVADNFTDGDDTGWTRFGGAGAGYTFPAGGYRLEAAAAPEAAFPNESRAASFRAAPAPLDFCAAADVTGWAADSDTAVSVLAGLQSSPTGESGCALTYSARSGTLVIQLVENGRPSAVLAESTVRLSLDPAKSYRLVFFGQGGFLEGRIYENSHWLAPLASVSEGPTTIYGAGRTGLMVSSAENKAVAAVFDNFRVNTGPAPDLLPAALADGAPELTWDAERALCWRLECSPDLTSWKATAGDELRGDRAALRIQRDPAGARKSLYYRFAKGPAAP